MAWRASMERLTLAGEREFYESAVSIFIRKGWKMDGNSSPRRSFSFRAGRNDTFCRGMVFLVAICERGEWRVYDRFCKDEIIHLRGI